MNVGKELRERAESLLREGRVDVVVGYQRGALPLTSMPAFAFKPEDARAFIFDPTCTMNLATFAEAIFRLHRLSQARKKPEERTKKRVAVVAKGCTARAIVVHLQEKRYSRADLYVIGVPCRGMLDRHKIEAKLAGRNVKGAVIHDNAVKIETADGDLELSLDEYMAENCATCRFRDPVIYDEFIGEPAGEGPRVGEEFRQVEDFGRLDPEERWRKFTLEISRCIRCNACRNACPMCYCHDCFIDQTKPRWFGVTDEMPDVVFFHIMRAFHVAGRCVDCGACSAACPMGIDLRLWLKKMDKDCLDLFGYKSGIDLEKVPPLATFDLGDPQNFMLEP